MGDLLTTVERARTWLSPDQGTLAMSQTELDTISRLVPAVSRLAMNYMGRDTLARTTRTETYQGGSTSRLLLRQWPVLGVSSLGIYPSASPLAATAYALEAPRPAGGAQRIYLSNGGTFASSSLNGVSVTYETGFVRTDVLIVPASAPYIVSTPAVWLADEGVALVGGAPVTGYTVEAGTYTFDSSLAGQQVEVTYSFVPEDIEQAVIHELSVLFRSRGHIGEASRAMANGGGTVAFLPLSLSAITQQMLQSYRRVVPQ